MSGGLLWGWVERSDPLSPCGLAVEGPGLAQLEARLEAYDATHLSRLKGVWGDGFAVILGANVDLPWLDRSLGVTWLGVDPRARALRLPTAVRPCVPLDWLERRLLSWASPDCAPLAVLPSRSLVVPLSAAVPLDASGGR